MMELQKSKKPPYKADFFKLFVNQISFYTCVFPDEVSVSFTQDMIVIKVAFKGGC